MRRAHGPAGLRQHRVARRLHRRRRRRLLPERAGRAGARLPQGPFHDPGRLRQPSHARRRHPWSRSMPSCAAVGDGSASTTCSDNHDEPTRRGGVADVRRRPWRHRRRRPGHEPRFVAASGQWQPCGPLRARRRRRSLRLGTDRSQGGPGRCLGDCRPVQFLHVGDHCGGAWNECLPVPLERRTGRGIRCPPRCATGRRPRRGHAAACHSGPIALARESPRVHTRATPCPPLTERIDDRR